MYTHHLVNDANHQAAAGANGNVVGAIEQLVERDLEAVAAGARVVVEPARGVVRHVLDLDLVVDGKLLVVAHGRQIMEVGVRVWVKAQLRKAHISIRLFPSGFHAYKNYAYMSEREAN